ncbi:MAG: protein-disulfide reductase DsbD N-terminal domain-containing protein [Planctomycetes bacterium]|nr:protein-disulfide reductase DsbD N-terminal domain-containing protein [Planctomycetota bacterium]
MINRFTYTLAAIALSLLASPAFGDPPSIKEILKKVEAKFEPENAKPGQTVTLKVTVQLLDGWHTYPTFQEEKGARSQTNKFTFPSDGAIVFVGELNEPANPKEKSEPVLGIEKMHYYPGGGVWTQKAVVRPTTAAGTVSSKIKFRILLCDKENCLPPKALDLEATLNVAGDAVAVDPAFKNEVDKAPKK